MLSNMVSQVSEKINPPPLIENPLNTQLNKLEMDRSTKIKKPSVGQPLLGPVVIVPDKKNGYPDRLCEISGYIRIQKKSEEWTGDHFNWPV